MKVQAALHTIFIRILSDPDLTKKVPTLIASAPKRSSPPPQCRMRWRGCRAGRSWACRPPWRGCRTPPAGGAARTAASPRPSARSRRLNIAPGLTPFRSDKKTSVPDPPGSEIIWPQWFGSGSWITNFGSGSVRNNSDPKHRIEDICDYLKEEF